MTATIYMVPRDLLTPTTPDRVASRLLACASSQVGYREGRDPNGDWNNDNAYGKYFGQNGVSWCHWFVSWAAVAAGIPATVIPRTGYTPTGWNFFTSHDRDVTSPRAGDIFYVYGYVPGEGNRVHHVGIVEKVLSGGRIKTLEGNTNTSGSAQGNGVYRLTRTVSSKLEFARPNYAAAVPAPTKPTPAKPTPVKPPAGNTIKPPTPEDVMTPAQMQELKNFIEARTQAYALANNNYTRQVLGTATKAILAASGDDDATTAVAELNAELDARDAEMLADIKALAPATPEA